MESAAETGVTQPQESSVLGLRLREAGHTPRADHLGVAQRPQLRAPTGEEPTGQEGNTGAPQDGASMSPGLQPN